MTWQQDSSMWVVSCTHDIHETHPHAVNKSNGAACDRFFHRSSIFMPHSVDQHNPSPQLHPAIAASGAFTDACISRKEPPLLCPTGSLCPSAAPKRAGTIQQHQSPHQTPLLSHRPTCHTSTHTHNPHQTPLLSHRPTCHTSTHTPVTECVLHRNLSLSKIVKFRLELCKKSISITGYRTLLEEGRISRTSCLYSGQ